MNINRDNYESYFLDYMEGRLSQEEKETFERFLKFNPDLEKEMDSIRLLKIPVEEISFPGKDKLKKEIPTAEHAFNPDQFDLFCIAYLEGDLTEKQRSSMEKYMVENPSAREILEKFRLAHLPPETIEYPDKQSLRRKPSRVIDWRIFAPVAAAAALAFFFFIGPGEDTAPVEVATIVEPEQKAETPEEKVVEEKASDTSYKPATLNVIRTKSAPVPVSDYKPEAKDQNTGNEKNSNAQTDRQRIAGNQLIPPQFNSPVESYDRITLRAVAPPEVNSRSLSLPDLARYQIQRATSVVEEEDDLLFNLASAGIKELNKRVGTESRLLASRDEEGDISGIQFRSRFFKLTTPLPGGDE